MAEQSPIAEYQGQQFPGVIGRTLDESSPAWPAPNRAPAGTPNVIVCCGTTSGSDSSPPSAGCATPRRSTVSPTAGCATRTSTRRRCAHRPAGALLTGRNHHSARAVGDHRDVTRLSGAQLLRRARARLPLGDAARSRLQHVRRRQVASDAADRTRPRPDRSTVGRSVAASSGSTASCAGSTDQWFPDLTYDNHPVSPPVDARGGLSPQHRPRRPGDPVRQGRPRPRPRQAVLPLLRPRRRALAAPRRARVDREVRGSIRRRVGRVPAGGVRTPARARHRRGHAELSERDPDVPAWEALSDDATRMYARQMEVYAGFIEQTDHHFGRVIDFVDGLGELDNTIVVVMSDNGASAEGGEHGTFNEALFFNGAHETLEDNLDHFDALGRPRHLRRTTRGGGPGRATRRSVAGNARPTGAASPIRASCRGRPASTRAVRSVTSTPTSSTSCRRLLDALGITPPEQIGGVDQSPIHGTSFAHTFADPSAPSDHTHPVLRDVREPLDLPRRLEGELPVAGAELRRSRREGSALRLPQLTADELEDLDATGWELYRLDDDPTETRNLAADEPAKLAEMIERWYHEAETYGVFPLASAGASRLLTRRPTIAANPQVQVWYPDAAPVYFGAGPKPYNRAYSITAEVTIPDGGAEGILVSHGSRHGGYALFVENGRLHHLYNYLAQDRFEVASNVDGTDRRRDAALRVRADRTDPVPRGQGPAGQRAALLRRRAGRRSRDAPHHAEPGRPGRVQLRLRSLRHGRPRHATRSRSASPATIHRVTYDITGDDLLQPRRGRDAAAAHPTVSSRRSGIQAHCPSRR